MWSQQPPYADVPERQVFQTFVDRRRSRTRRRIAFLAFVVVVIVGGWIARPHFPGVEAQLRRKIWDVFHPAH